MYTYHYHDGRFADWGDYARHGALLAIEEINASGLLGTDRIRLRPENTIDYHCWPENAALMAESLMQKDILVLTGAGCSGPAVEIANVAAHFGVAEIAFFHTTDAGGLGAKKVIHNYADRREIKILKEFGFPRDTDYATIEAYVREVRDAGIRHIVMTGPTPDTVRLFRALHVLDMNRPRYTFPCRFSTVTATRATTKQWILSLSARSIRTLAN